MGQDDKGWSALVTPLVDRMEEWWVTVMRVGLDPELSKMARALESGDPLATPAAIRSQPRQQANQQHLMFIAHPSTLGAEGVLPRG